MNTVMCVHFSVCPNRKTRLLLDGFEFDYNLTRITGTLNAGLCKFATIPRLGLLRMRNVSDKKLWRTSPPPRNVPFTRTWNMAAPYRPQKTIRRRKDAIGMPDNKGRNTDTHIFNTHCFSTATMVARTPLNITLYLQRLSCRTEICQERSLMNTNVWLLCGYSHTTARRMVPAYTKCDVQFIKGCSWWWTNTVRNM